MDINISIFWFACVIKTAWNTFPTDSINTNKKRKEKKRNGVYMLKSDYNAKCKVFINRGGND